MESILTTNDIGGWAKHYAASPYGHYKNEVYPLYIDILSSLAQPPRVLDIGAGPGHLAFEYFRAHPNGAAKFTLMDASRELLVIASERLAIHAQAVRTVHRSFNLPQWDEGLDACDAVVSNNALFNLKPEHLDGFYGLLSSLIGKSGLVLNQQSFSYSDRNSPYGDEPFAEFMRALPEHIMPPMSRVLTATERADMERVKCDAIARQRQALNALDSKTVEFAKSQEGYFFLTVDEHLASLRRAGFLAGCIWRKKEFAVVLGLKGRPDLLAF